MFANWSKNWLNNSAMINKNSNSDHSKSLMTWTRPSRNSRKLFADFRPDFMLNFWSFHAPIHAKRQNSRYIHALKVRLYRKIEFISLNWKTKTLIFQSLFRPSLFSHRSESCDFHFDTSGRAVVKYIFFGQFAHQICMKSDRSSINFLFPRLWLVNFTLYFTLIRGISKRVEFTLS